MSSALGACADGECPHTVVALKREREVDTQRTCDGIRVINEGEIVRFGVDGQACADLCEDSRMNACELPADYAAEFNARNSIADAGSDHDCPPWDDTIRITCKREEARGKYHDGCPISGRRPTGLLATRRREPDAVADFLARAAHLEAASVFAFDKLAEDLSRLGAPASLIDDCLRAARDETEHAQLMGRLARARGARPLGVDVMTRGNPSPLELALENAVEGVVREAYGALQASVSARKARDSELRSAMAGIAEDEAAHAWLALRIAQWLDTRLSRQQRLQVEQAKQTAIAALRAELRHEPPTALRDELGLPSRTEALHLLTQLEQTVWSLQQAA